MLKLKLKSKKKKIIINNLKDITNNKPFKLTTNINSNNLRVPKIPNKRVLNFSRYFRRKVESPIVHIYGLDERTRLFHDKNLFITGKKLNHKKEIKFIDYTRRVARRKTRYLYRIKHQICNEKINACFEDFKSLSSLNTLKTAKKKKAKRSYSSKRKIIIKKFKKRAKSSLLSIKLSQSSLNFCYVFNNIYSTDVNRRIMIREKIYKDPYSLPKRYWTWCKKVLKKDKLWDYKKKKYISLKNKTLKEKLTILAYHFIIYDGIKRSTKFSHFVDFTAQRNKHKKNKCILQKSVRLADIRKFLEYKGNLLRHEARISKKFHNFKVYYSNNKLYKSGVIFFNQYTKAKPMSLSTFLNLNKKKYFSFAYLNVQKRLSRILNKKFSRDRSFIRKYSKLLRNKNNRSETLALYKGFKKSIKSVFSLYKRNLSKYLLKREKGRKYFKKYFKECLQELENNVKNLDKYAVKLEPNLQGRILFYRDKLVFVNNKTIKSLVNAPFNQNIKKKYEKHYLIRKKANLFTFLKVGKFIFHLKKIHKKKKKKKRTRNKGKLSRYIEFFLRKRFYKYTTWIRKSKRKVSTFKKICFARFSTLFLYNKEHFRTRRNYLYTKKKILKNKKKHEKEKKKKGKKKKGYRGYLKYLKILKYRRRKSMFYRKKKRRNSFAQTTFNFVNNTNSLSHFVKDYKYVIKSFDKNILKYLIETKKAFTNKKQELMRQKLINLEYRQLNRTQKNRAKKTRKKINNRTLRRLAKLEKLKLEKLAKEEKI